MRIELDTTINEGESPESVALKMIDGLHVTAKVVTEQGPSGWPIIAYTSDDAQALREVARRYGDGTEELVFPN